MNFGMIASGGTGTRMGYDIPKQFLELAGKPILNYSIEKFLDVTEIDFICVGVPKLWLDKTRQLVSKYFKNDEARIKVVCGGDTRSETIMNILEFAEKNLANDNTENFAVTHDSARPFLTENMIKKTLKIAQSGIACTVAEKLYDTIAETNDQKKKIEISKFLDREKLVKIQTPQSFNMRKFMELYKNLTKFQKSQITDCTGVFFSSGEKVEILVENEFNLKITTKQDYELAKKVTSELINKL